MRARACCRPPRRSEARCPVPEHLFLSEAEWEAGAARGRSRSRRRSRRSRCTLFATERNPASACRAFIGEQREAGRRVVLAAADERDLKLLARRAGNEAAERPRPVSGWEEILGAAPGAVLLLRADFDAGFVRPAGRGRGDRRRRICSAAAPATGCRWS